MDSSGDINKQLMDLLFVGSKSQLATKDLSPPMMSVHLAHEN